MNATKYNRKRFDEIVVFKRKDKKLKRKDSENITFIKKKEKSPKFLGPSVILFDRFYFFF